MLSTQEKLLEFSRSIERELKGQIEQIDRDIENYRATQLQKIEDEVRAGAERSVQRSIAEINLQFTTRRSQAVSETKKKLLLKRDAYAGIVFDEARERLRAFAASAEYGPWLRGKLRAAAQEYRLKEPVVSVRGEDLALEELIRAELPGCAVKQSAEITLGGFIIEDSGKSYIINESLDNTLEEQREWFFANSGLRITQN